MNILYRTIEGEVIEYIIEEELTVSHIDRISMMYYEKTSRIPDCIFIDMAHYARLINKIGQRIHGPTAAPFGSTVLGFQLSMGFCRVEPMLCSYIPILAGSRVEYDDNNFNKIFEETVLKDCEVES
jgi:hypothetical protein